MRLKIPNLDRVGLVLDISQALADRQINILSMEVELRTMYLEIVPLSDSVYQELVRHLKTIGGILEVHPIELMPHQERAEQLKAVLTAVGDGILAIGHDGCVTQYNPAAQQILRIPAEKMLGRPLSEALPDNTLLLDTLHHGKIFTHREFYQEDTQSHYLLSSRTVTDQAGRTIGAVAILKDIRDVRDLVHKITGQLPLTFSEILHVSHSMKQVVALAKAYARGGSTVLIRGETGTGKELFARALHAASSRSDEIFIPVNCAAIPDTLLESELFGYEEGAFTGASKGGKQGLFELANGGTLFLDEIGEISGPLQAKLLRVLQDKKIRRIGGNREISVDVRILAATNRNLEDMIAKDRFREDLYYRLNVIPLYLPALRERREDIPLLAQFFLQRFTAKLNKPVDAISETALQTLEQYNWPGNIRELENVIERAVNIVDGPILLSEHILLYREGTAAPAPSAPRPRKLHEILADTEREVLRQAQRQHRTSRQLGQALGLSHTAVLNKLRKHGLQETDS